MELFFVEKTRKIHLKKCLFPHHIVREIMGEMSGKKNFFFSILQLMDRMKSSAKQNENKTTLN